MLFFRGLVELRSDELPVGDVVAGILVEILQPGIVHIAIEIRVDFVERVELLAFLIGIFLVGPETKRLGAGFALRSLQSVKFVVVSSGCIVVDEFDRRRCDREH